MITKSSNPEHLYHLNPPASLMPAQSRYHSVEQPVLARGFPEQAQFIIELSCCSWPLPRRLMLAWGLEAKAILNKSLPGSQKNLKRRGHAQGLQGSKLAQILDPERGLCGKKETVLPVMLKMV